MVNKCRGALLLHLLDAYASGYTQMLEGCSERMPVAELAGGARIRHIFREIFMKGLDKLNPARWPTFPPIDHLLSRLLILAC